MNGFDSQVSVVNTYLPLETKETWTGANYFTRSMYVLLFGVRCVRMTRHDIIMYHALFVLYLNENRAPRGCDKGIPVPQVLCNSLTEVTEVPGKGREILQNLHKLRVRVQKCYRTHRSSGYCDTGVQNSQKFRAGLKMVYPYPGYLWHGRTELTEVPGTGMNIVQTLLKFRVRVWML